MKTLYLTACLVFTAGAYAQIEYKVLEQNNVSAFVSNGGTLFYDFTTEPAGYEVPKGSGNNLLNGVQFWFGGLDANGTEHLSLGGLDADHRDVFPGPHSSTGNYANNGNWMVWTICQSDIDVFKAWWESTLPGANPDPNLQEPSTGTMIKIITWPAHGDVSQGQNYNMAPFYDRDQNGVYDPAAGDYPIIKGCCATYMVQNDMGGLHTVSGTGPIGLEIHYMVYQYESGDYINNTTFIDMMAINRGSVTYNDFAYGIMADGELGFYNDDFIGSDSLNGMLYFYNGDNNDEGFYGNNPPAAGIVSLNKPVSSCAPYTGALSSSQSWSVLKGLQSDGTSWLDEDNQPTQFVFSGNPVNAGEWSELESGNTPGDRRGIMTHNPGHLSPGDTIFQSYAILYARSGDNLQNVEELMQQAVDVKAFYMNDTLMCSAYSAGIKEKQAAEFTLHPNPSSGLIHLEIKGQQAQIEVLELSGKQILSAGFKAGDKTLDLSALPKGMYLLRLTVENESSIQKIILQ